MTAGVRARARLRASAAVVLLVAAVAVAVLLNDLSDAGTSAKVWLLCCAVGAAWCAAVVAFANLAGRAGQTIAGFGVWLAVLTLVLIVLGGLFLVVDNRQDPADAFGLGVMTGILALGGLLIAVMTRSDSRPR